MFELNGKYNSAKIFTDTADNTTISQISNLCNIEKYKNNKIRIMPDCHAGAGCTIGTTMTLTDAVTPNLVGVDIGCGMLAIRLKEHDIDFEAFDKIITENFNEYYRVSRIKPDEKSKIEQLKCAKSANIDFDRIYQSIGSLGGGNHFIELDKDELTDDIWLVIHTGSRHLGIKVCKYYQEQAHEQMAEEKISGSYDFLSKKIIESCKKSRKQNEIPARLDNLKKEISATKTSINKDEAYCTGELMDNYIHDMSIVQDFARINRSTIAKIILTLSGLTEVERFETIHNYIDIENMILRKGAVSAQNGEKLIIPINMRDGSLICVGKGNEDWNYSAPHGAGRLYSRSAAKAKFTVEEYKETMQNANIYSSSVNESTLDECPMTYKPIENIIADVKDAVDIVSIIKPVYNFKSGIHN